MRIPDDTSAYFYAQVGVGRCNRYHVTDIFAAIAEVELCEQDWRARGFGPRLNRAVVHLGASTQDKVYPPELWVKALSALKFDGEIILVGSGAERGLAETVMSQVTGKNLVNHAGATTLPELMDLIAGARLLIGADSARCIWRR